MHDREIAYQKYINEITDNDNSRMDNIVLCAGPTDKHKRHIASQVDLAFQAGWHAALQAFQKEYEATIPE